MQGVPQFTILEGGTFKIHKKGGTRRYEVLDAIVVEIVLLSMSLFVVGTIRLVVYSNVAFV